MPPRSKYARLVANRVFTNRERPIAWFNAARDQLPLDQHRILTFYGIGGQGKTALCRKLREILAGEDPRLALWGNYIDILHAQNLTEDQIQTRPAEAATAAGYAPEEWRRLAAQLSGP